MHQVAKAAREKPLGVPVLGWLEWCLTDNYEWAAGYTPKFGLYSYDKATFKRTPRSSSVSVMTQMAKSNSIPGSLADQYLSAG
jgi:beta-glucosidase/6-phospho-beta-glucosidase/beta-galactosidase